MKKLQTVVFVYAKGGKIKVLPHEESNANHTALIAAGWVHTQTLDPCAFLANLYHDPESALDEIESLGKKPRTKNHI